MINIARPDQTPADADDQDLAKWASLRLWRLKRREINRVALEMELSQMGDREARAREWLNYYRDMAKHEN